MKKKLVLTVVCIVLALALFCSCSPAEQIAPEAEQTVAPSESPSEEASALPATSLEIKGEGIELTLSPEEMMALPMETFDTTNVSSTGEVSDVTVTGFSLEELLVQNGTSLAEMGTITFNSADGYVTSVAKEEYADVGIFMIFEEEDGTMMGPRSCLPGKRAMYWAKDVVSIELGAATGEAGGEESETATVSSIQFFFENATQMTPADIDVDGTSYPFYSLSEYFETYVGELPTAALSLVAKDGYVKTETPDVFNTASVSMLEGSDMVETHAPYYYSADMSAGMTVKQLDYVISGDTAIYFGKETDVQTLLEATGTLGATEYKFIASDGFETVVPADAIEFGKIYPDEEEGFIRAEFEGYDWGDTKGGGTVKYLSEIVPVGLSGATSQESEESSEGAEESEGVELLKCFVGDERVTITEEQFMALPQVEMEISRTNSFDETTVGTYKGVHWTELAKAIGADPDTSATVVASDDFEMVISSEILNDPGSMFALYQDGEYIESEGDGRVWFCASENFTANNWAKFVVKIVVD